MATPPATPHVEVVRQLAEEEGAEVVVISAQVEAELAELEGDERAEYLADLGLERSGLERLIDRAYRLLGLLTYFTAGPQEARAWTVPGGSTAPRAAREIHTDFERGFIKAEVIAFDDYDRLGSEAAARDAGPAAHRGQGVRRRRRRRHPLPLQRLIARVRGPPARTEPDPDEEARRWPAPNPSPASRSPPARPTGWTSSTTATTRSAATA